MSKVGLSLEVHAPTTNYLHWHLSPGSKTQGNEPGPVTGDITKNFGNFFFIQKNSTG